MSHLYLVAPLMLVSLLAQGCAGSPRSRNILLISLDSTRADHVDTGSGGRAWTPELRRFAESAWVFENAYSPIPQTLPAHLALLSGRLPHELGVLDNEAVFDGRRPLLTQELQRRGWETAAVVSLGTLAEGTGFARGFSRFRGPALAAGQFSTPAGQVTDMAIQELRRPARGKRFLFVHYSDPHSPYAPPGVEGRFTVELDSRPLASFNAYTGSILRLRLPVPAGTHRLTFRLQAPGEDFNFFILRRLRVENGTISDRRDLEFSAEHYGGSFLMRGPLASARVHCRTNGALELFQVIPILSAGASRENYRREVQYMDAQVGRLLRALEDGPEAGQTAVIVFADHGEGLGERESYSGHVRFLNRQFIHVPLIARFPGESPRRFRDAVGLRSIASWTAEALGIADAPLPASGPSLAELRRGRWRPGLIRSYAFAPSSREDRCSLIDWPFQLIVSRRPGADSESREYYDLRLPCERRQSAIPPELVRLQAPSQWRRFEQSRPGWRAAFARRARRHPSAGPAQLETLETAGYIRMP